MKRRFWDRIIPSKPLIPEPPEEVKILQSAYLLGKLTFEEYLEEVEKINGKATSCPVR